jgi:TatA/E family protein of Tat protein translocase
LVLLILESLGSTELVFILMMALVFFGPRKLPQLSRTLGKNLANFRRASEDFKRTWDKEVSLEEFNIAGAIADPAKPSENNSIREDVQATKPLQPPTIEAVPAERVIPRQSPGADDLRSTEEINPIEPAEPLRKRDWL